MATQRDYERTAAVVRKVLKKFEPLDNYAHSRYVLMALVSEFAAVYQADNPRFDIARFTKACLDQPKENSHG